MPEHGGTPWYSNHGNLSLLWSWLEERGETPADGPAYFMEKPWKWDTEWLRYVADLHAQRVEEYREIR